jgi:Trypsin-like peptidase domain/von Willebrand factor type A domain
VSHNIGRIVPVAGFRVGPDTGDAPSPAGTWERMFTPQPALAGGTPRFVILHFTAMDLPGASRVEVDLGYGQDVFTAGQGNDAWTRPIDPPAGPIRIRYLGPGPTGGVTLAEYGSGEPWTTTYGPIQSWQNSVTNADLFLHTDPYQEPTYQVWLRCGGVFNWENAACAAAGSATEAIARAVGIIISLHDHGGERLLSTCSGTLIDTNLFLTARHCITDPTGADIRSASVTFDFQTTCGGGRPGGYSPRFYKVRRRVAGGVGSSMNDDWLILEIDPPAGIAPRQLRSTNAVAGEAVVAVHHPNGSVKKLQAGTLTSGNVNSVSGFDYGGGSSGSALFDAAGRVIGAALSTGSPGADQCNVGYSSARAVLDHLANPPAPPTPLDVMVVIDRSGSMALPGSAPGRTKMDEARDAASLFVQLVRTGAGDRLGMVSFSTTATSPPETPPAAVTPAHKQSLVGPAPFTGGTVGSLSPTGMTSIGDGLRIALQALGTTSNQRAILLLTDGLQNTSPMVAAVESQLGNTQLCVVGFGAEWNLDGALLDRVAREHGGLYTRAGDGLALKKFFALCFGNIFETGMLVDPQLVLPANQSTAPDLEFDVCDEDRITVVVGWAAPGDDLAPTLVTPGGATVAAGSGVITERGRTWWFVRVPLPYAGERVGRWRLRVARAVLGELQDTSKEIPYFAAVLADGGPRLDALVSERRLYTGDRVSPRVALLYTNGTTPHAHVEVTVEGPGVSLGRLVSERGLVTPDVQGEPVDAFRATLQAIAGDSGGEVPLQRSSTTVHLHDDGVHDDGGMEADGIYGNPLDDLLRFEGEYTFHAVATYDDGCPARREVMWSLHVDPGIDSGRTDVRLLATADGSGTIRVTPNDRYGNPLGPGRSPIFEVTAQPGTNVTGPVVDNRDGSYDVPVSWDPGRPPGVLVSQPERNPVPLAPPAAHGIDRLGCLPWVLLALVIALLIVILIVLLVS